MFINAYFRKSNSALDPLALTTESKQGLLTEDGEDILYDDQIADEFTITNENNEVVENQLGEFIDGDV